MKHNATLIVTSLLSTLLLSIHVTQDIVRGVDRWGRLSLVGVLILVVLLYGALVLAARRSGLIIMLLGGILAAAMPVVHARVNMAKGGAFLFIWIRPRTGDRHRPRRIARRLRHAGNLTPRRHARAARTSAAVTDYVTDSPRSAEIRSRRN